MYPRVHLVASLAAVAISGLSEQPVTESGVAADVRYRASLRQIKLHGSPLADGLARSQFLLNKGSLLRLC